MRVGAAGRAPRRLRGLPRSGRRAGRVSRFDMACDGRATNASDVIRTVESCSGRPVFALRRCGAYVTCGAQRSRRHGRNNTIPCTAILVCACTQVRLGITADASNYGTPDRDALRTVRVAHGNVGGALDRSTSRMQPAAPAGRSLDCTVQSCKQASTFETNGNRMPCRSLAKSSN